MTVEDTFKSIVLSTANSTAALPDDQGVKTRGMKKQSLTPTKKITSNDKHDPKSPHSNATAKRALAQINEDNDIARPEPATPSHKKQKMSPTDTTTMSRGSTMISVDTPETKISTSATTSPAETSNADTSNYPKTQSPSNMSTAETSNADTSNHEMTKSSSNASPAETPNADTSNHQNTKSSLKAAARTKSEVQRKRAMDRARRAETRAKQAEALLMSAHNKSPERLKLGLLGFFNEQLASKSEQIETLGQQVEEREIEIAQQKGRIRSHVD